MEVYPGELVSLIGPNGSGKTTLFNCISGLLRADSGRITFKGEDITRKRADLIAREGIRRTFQDVRNFPGLTVLENLLIAIQQQQEDSIWQRAVRTPRIRRLDEEARARADEILQLVELTELQNHRAGELSYGQRKLMEFAAALMPDPDLILLDEPAAAVSGYMIERIKSYIQKLHAEGKTFLVVEHNMNVVMDLSERIVVLNYGQKIAEGTPQEIQQIEKVLEAYFGS
jgi:ABC-type branched-subunit amino acid transport system ATPase component